MRNFMKIRNAENTGEIALALARSRSPGGSGALVPIATIAALQALDTTGLQTGTEVYVQQLQDWFLLVRTNAQAPDNLTIVAAGGTGGGNWLREIVVNPNWLVTVSWFIDPVAGNDLNAGNLIGSPIKTWAEFTRRNGAQLSVPSGVAFNIQWLSSQPNTNDPVVLDVTLYGTATFSMQGTTTVAQAGVLTTNTAFVRVATPQQVAATPSVTTFVNSLMVDTVTGALTWIDKDLGAGVARLSAPVTNALFATTVTAAAMNDGNAYQVLTLPAIALGSVKVVRIPGATIGLAEPFSLYRMQFLRASNSAFERMQMYAEGGLPLVQDCDFGNTNPYFSGNNWQIQNCQIPNVAVFASVEVASAATAWLAGRVGDNGALVVRDGGDLGVGKDAMFSGGSLSGVTQLTAQGGGAKLVTGQVQIWDTATITATEGAVWIAQSFAGGVVLWGSTGTAWRIGNGSNAFYSGTVAATFTLTASAGFKVGGLTAAFGVTPATGAFVGPTNTTLAFFAAALAAGTGLAGIAVDVLGGSRIAPRGL